METLLAETSAFWASASARIKSCGRCPEEGGACAGSKSAIEDGVIVEASRGAPSLRHCAKWDRHLYRQKLFAANVPRHLAGTRLDSLILGERAREVIDGYVAKARSRPSTIGWLVVTGGAPQRRAELLVALMHEVAHARRGGTAWFDWCPRLAVVSRVYLDDRSGEDPRQRHRQTGVLALDFVDPTRWQPWFTDSVDELLYARAGRPTLLGTGLPIEQLAAALPLSSQCLGPEASIVPGSEVRR